jgi:hypothetical protein
MSAPNPIVLSDQDTRVEVSGLVLTETFRPPGLVLPAHSHEHANIALTLEGSFVETVATHPYEVNPSSVIFRPAGEKHSNRYGKTAARCLIIEVQPERLAAIRDFTRILEAMPTFAGRPLKSSAELQTSSARYVMDILRQSGRTWPNSKTNSAQFANASRPPIPRSLSCRCVTPGDLSRPA